MSRLYALSDRSREILEKSCLVYDTSLSSAGVSDEQWANNQFTIKELETLSKHFDYILTTLFYERSAEILPPGGICEWKYDYSAKKQYKEKMHQHGLIEKKPMTIAQRDQVVSLIKDGMPVVDIAKKLGKPRTTISDIKRKHVDGKAV
jgi:hypothetical protein